MEKDIFGGFSSKECETEGEYLLLPLAQSQRLIFSQCNIKFQLLNLGDKKEYFSKMTHQSAL